MQAEIKRDKRNPRPGESKQVFMDRGGIVGAQEYANVKWNETLGEFVSKSPTENMSNKQKADYYANR